jgi:lysophospholipase L1-like esterase
MVQKYTPVVGNAPQALLVAPPPIQSLPDYFTLMFAGAIQKSKLFSEEFQKVVQECNYEFLDAGKIISSSSIDGIHLTAEAHVRLGKAIALKVRTILK